MNTIKEMRRQEATSYVSKAKIHNSIQVCFVSRDLGQNRFDNYTES